MSGLWNSAPQRVMHEEARLEQLRYWVGKTVDKRLEASDALTVRLLKSQGIERNELKADLDCSPRSETRALSMRRWADDTNPEPRPL